MTIKALIHTPSQWLYNLIIEMIGIKCVIEMLGNVINAIIISHNHNDHLLLHERAEQLASGMGRF